MLDESGARIILLVAPAGYGKTTLAREWLEEGSRNTVSYCCGPASADVAALSAGLAETLTTITPGAGERMTQRLRATDRPDDDASVFAEMLAEDLVEWPHRAWLMIDDYHFATASVSSEAFVETLLERSPVRVLLTSRTRPRWANARKRVYGEILELDRTLLCMTDGEAAAVLAGARNDVVSVIGRAAGWPAVIGLAALTKDVPSGDEVPPTLLAYFTEELYQAVPPGRRWDLCQLAIPPALSAELIEHLFAEDATDVVEIATHLGVLTPGLQDAPEIHPLMQHFLRSKLTDHPSADVRLAVTSVGAFYVDRGEWDHAFTVAVAFDDASLALRVIYGGLEDVLAMGRVSTVGQWLEFATDRFVEDPILELAEAELAFRQGFHSQTESLAGRAARRLAAQGTAELAAIAHARAGRAAHLAGHETNAVEHHDEALRLTTRQGTEREALWGKFVALLESGRTKSAESVLASLVQKDSGHVDDALRLASGHYLLSMHSGRQPDVDSLLVALHLLPRCGSPMVRSSFLNSCAGGLAFAGRYAEAHRVAEQQVDDATTYRLGFALPHAYIRRASAACGLRRFREAFRLLDQAEEAANAIEQQWIVTAVGISRGVTFLGTGNPEAALGATQRAPDSRISPALQGEHFALRALACACLAKSEKSRELAVEAMARTKAVEVTALCVLAQAVAALASDSDSAESLAAQAFEYVWETQAIDLFVASYRAYPALLAILPRVGGDRLLPIIEQACDRQLARVAGIDLPAANRDTKQILSPREREVWSLMAQGFSNREIAQRLFLSESTVKVHVRHVFDKLGAKTRVDAVVKGQSLLA